MYEIIMDDITEGRARNKKKIKKDYVRANCRNGVASGIECSTIYTRFRGQPADSLPLCRLFPTFVRRGFPSTPPVVPPPFVGFFPRLLLPLLLAFP